MLLVISVTVVALILVVVLYVVTVYNRYQKLRNGAEATLGQIKVALKKRLDVLSQLVENLKSYASFEKETLEKITQLRTSVLKANSPKEIQEIDAESRRIFGNVLVSFENYPELKTSVLSKDVNDAVRNLEDEIARYRYTYNNIVQEFNTLLDTFPSNLIGSAFNFRKMEYLKFGEELEKTLDLSWKV